LQPRKRVLAHWTGGREPKRESTGLLNRAHDSAYSRCQTRLKPATVGVRREGVQGCAGAFQGMGVTKRGVFSSSREGASHLLFKTESVANIGRFREPADKRKRTQTRSKANTPGLTQEPFYQGYDRRDHKRGNGHTQPIKITKPRTVNRSGPGPKKDMPWSRREKVGNMVTGTGGRPRNMRAPQKFDPRGVARAKRRTHAGQGTSEDRKSPKKELDWPHIALLPQKGDNSPWLIPEGGFASSSRGPKRSLTKEPVDSALATQSKPGQKTGASKKQASPPGKKKEPGPF